MKHLKFLAGGVGKGHIALLLALAMILSTASAFAIDTGDSISFRHKFGSDDTTDIFTASGGWEGTCAEIGKSSPSSGTATATVLGKNNKTTKIAYHYGYVKGWQSNMNGYKGWASTYGEVYSHLIRVAYMGFSSWEAGFRAVAGGNDPTAMINEVRALWDGVDDLSSAPDNFECIRCDQGNNQTFVMFRIAPTGKLKLKKASSNTGITG